MGWSADYMRKQGYEVDAWSENYLEYQEIEQSTRGWSRTKTPQGEAKRQVKRELKKPIKKIKKRFGTQSHKIMTDGRLVNKRK